MSNFYTTEYRDSYWNYRKPLKPVQKHKISSGKKQSEEKQIPDIIIQRQKSFIEEEKILKKKPKPNSSGVVKTKNTKDQNKSIKKQKGKKSFIFTNTKTLDIKPRVIVHLQQCDTSNITSDESSNFS